MSYIEPPTLTNIRKRKRSVRSASVASSVVSHLPRDAIDPHSYGPSARRQLVVAGLTHSDRLPSDYVEGFPHRPLPDGVGGDAVDDAKADKDKHGFGSGFGFEGDGSDDEDDIDTDSDNDTENENGSIHSDAGLYDTTEDDDDGGGGGGGGGGGDPAENAARLAVKQRRLRRREARRRRNALRMQRAYDHNVGVLATIVQRGLQEAAHGTLPGVSTATGEAGQLAAPIGLARAKRAFGLLLRTDVKGRRVDLRKNDMWAMGAELLMREGEDEGDKGRPRRWGSAANMPPVRAFYEDLIQQHPYNRLFPRSVNALTFWPALAGTELYNIHTEVQLANERLDAKAKQRRKKRETRERAAHGDGEVGSRSEDASDSTSNSDADANQDSDSPDANSNDSDGHRRRRRRNHPDRLAREDIRHAALEQLHDLARRMDAVMAGPPYATSPEMLRLRGMVALYMGDLAIVTPPRTQPETQEGERVRAQEQSRARARFARLLEVDRDVQSGRQHKRGGVPDTVVDAYIQSLARGGGDVHGHHSSSEEEDDDTVGHGMNRPTFSSLPFRSQ
ncbi:hypothetical protein HMPREF1624_06096 [Sporothrix schenckii ATCC 58251]|uniref:Uncharacterized protein n=1 Tax=Sporothrix schenckii (strain ATCC 58251 / de Perez 2211183) TaxID=1391915 RepID=U7PTY2_SPOS1|nr:hypothetical protein HMPREF1624_06096 [Sporothrix schenckii ATCC 58251]